MADIGRCSKGDAAEYPERFVWQPVGEEVRRDYSNPPVASLVDNRSEAVCPRWVELDREHVRAASRESQRQSAGAWPDLDD